MDNSLIDSRIGWRAGLVALSPVALFLCLYLVVSVVIGDFYKMPIAVALGIASIWSVAIYRGQPLVKRIDTYSGAAANTDILYMIWVFVLAGAFAMLAKGIGSVDATVNAVVGVFPSRFLVPGIFWPHALYPCLSARALALS